MTNFHLCQVLKVLPLQNLPPLTLTRLQEVFLPKKVSQFRTAIDSSICSRRSWEQLSKASFCHRQWVWWPHGTHTVGPQPGRKSGKFTNHHVHCPCNAYDIWYMSVMSDRLANSNDQVFASSWTGSPGGSSSSSSSSDSSGSQPTTSAGQQSGSSGSSSGQQASSSTSQQQTRSPPEGQEDEGTPATRSEPLFSLRIVVSLAALVLFMFSSYE